MAQLIFLNERSHPTGEIHPAVASALLTDLVNVLLRIKRFLPRASLISAEPLPTLRIGDNYSVARWLNESGPNRERARFLLSLAQQAPFRIAKDLFGDPDPGVTVCRIAGEMVEGIGLAHLYGGFPVSFCFEERWRAAILRLNSEQLLEDGVYHSDFEVRHASLMSHVDTHRSWLTSVRRRDIRNVLDLCARTTEIFSHIEFGPGIESDLSSLERPAFLQVVEYLCRLDDDLAAWDPTARSFPEYTSHTTNESDSRKELCRFPAPEGGRAYFTWHGRYTPGPGRIHFRLDGNPKRATLGYIGRKVGT